MGHAGAHDRRRQPEASGRRPSFGSDRSGSRIDPFPSWPGRGRRGFGDAQKQRKVSEEERGDLLGHVGKSEAAERYCDAYEIEILYDLGCQVPIVTTHLTPRPLQLLSWVCEKKIAPFSKEARKISRPARSRLTPGGSSARMRLFRSAALKRRQQPQTCGQNSPERRLDHARLRWADALGGIWISASCSTASQSAGVRIGATLTPPIDCDLPTFRADQRWVSGRPRLRIGQQPLTRRRRVCHEKFVAN